MRTVKATVTDLLSPVIVTKINLHSLPYFEPNVSINIQEMDYDNGGHIRDWIEIHNGAFKRNWKRAEFERAMTGNKTVRVIKTFFLNKNGVPVGTASIGNYHANNRIGTGHYLCLMPEFQGKGLGKYLAHFRYNELKKLNFSEAESETRINCTKSIYIHFELGFEPKNKMDPWNSARGSSMVPETIASARLNRLHESWMKTKTTGGYFP